MRAEVIAIGDELTSGQRLDTNSQWLSQQLGLLGIRTIRHTTVGDDLSANVEAMRLAAGRADFVICTGGLGPTQDDLTRQAMADAFGRRLVLDEESLAHIVGLFARFRRDMPERNRIQAMFPEGSVAIPNPHGSAPGIDLTVSEAEKSSRFFALPGVPAEMKEMWAATVVPRIETVLGVHAGPLRYHLIKVFGIGESHVEELLPDLIAREREPTVGITVSRATISLRIAGRAKEEATFQQLIQPTVQAIEKAMGELIFGTGDVELEDVVSQQLASQELTMGCVEIGAANFIGDWMLSANVAVSSDSVYCPFVTSVTFPTLPHAMRWAQVSDTNPGDLAEDKKMLQALAAEARCRFSSDLALVVGRYPSASEMAHASGAFDFYFVLAVPKGEPIVLRKSLGGHPDVLGARVAKAGLDLVRRSLATHPLK